MNRRTFGVGLTALMAVACRRQPDKAVAKTTAGRPSVKNDLVVLTRDGCVNTPDMLNNVDDALRALGLALDYEVINLASLPATDARLGYPTPTVLVRGRDIDDKPEPTPPFPEPS